MAIETVREKESASIDSLDVPYYVRDPAITPGSELDRVAAIAAAGAQAFADVGEEAQDYAYERLSYNVARVVIQYRDVQLSPLHPLASGSIEAGFNALPFAPIHRKHSLGTIGAFKASDGTAVAIGTGTDQAPPHHGAVNKAPQGEDPFQIDGYDLTLPPETDYVNYVIPNASFTSAYRAIVNGLLYHVCDDTFFGFAAGEVMLLRASARQRTNDDLFLSFGFSTRPNGVRTFDGIDTAAAIQGHDLTWVWSWATCFGGRPILVPLYIYVERIWPQGDMSLLALPGS